MMAEEMCVLILVLISSNLVLGPPMDPLRASVTNEEQWAFIKLHVLLVDSAAEVYRLLHKFVKSLALSERRHKTLQRICQWRANKHSKTTRPRKT